MKNQIRFGRGARLLALLMSALLLLGVFPAGALAGLEEKGSLTVQLKEDTYANLPKTPAVAVTLYQIGEAAPDVKAGWRIFEAFSGYNILSAKEDSELGAIAARMGEDIVGKDGFSGTEKTLQNGQALFSNLDQGVYLGVLTGGPEGLEVDPFIVTVPSKDPKTGEPRYNYDVTLKDRCVTEATVRKDWDDKDNQDGIRPENLAVTLSDGESIIQTVKLNVFNGWQYTVSNLPRYKGGKAIAYTWTEEALPKGYELTGTATEGVVTTLTNRHVPETTSVTVRKEWDDANNQDGIRPESLKVTLSDGQSVELNEANGWTATIDNLPKFEKGKEITYSWTENGLPEGYVLAGTATEGVITTLKNRHVPETVSATVRKVWDDNDNQDDVRPESLTVKLSNGQSVELNEANKWEGTITNLPKYDNGKEIAYTWTEEGLPEGYELTGTATEGMITTLTNRHIPETTSATVRKVWSDANDQDGIRPESLTVKLSNGQSVELNEANKWEATIDNLPKYDKGVEIAYTWTEEGLPEGYELTGTATEGTITTLTNSYTPGLTSVTVRKVWDDADNQDGIRPESLTVRLSNGQSATLNEANKWEATIDNLPKYDKGVEIAYTWTEEGLPEGYELTGTATEGMITTLTNRHVPETTSATVRKVWSDANDQDDIRPSSLTVKLSNGQSVTLNEANNWEATITDLPKYENGEEIAYTWTEESLPEGYALTGTATEGTITTLTNSHTPGLTSVTVRKVWDDADNQDDIRPESLTVRLSNGQRVTLNEANGWRATIDNLPMFADGKTIAYTWTEEGLPEGYELTGTATEGAITTLTNSHTPEMTSVTVRKVWDDDGNRDGIRPASLTVKLSNGQSVTLNEENNWEATIDNLPVFADGKKIVYTWTEEDLPEGYTLGGTATEGTITTLINLHEPERISIQVIKHWNDNDNQDGIRPDNVTMALMDGPTVVARVTLNEENNWRASVHDLYKYANGREINYTWTEEDVPAGYTVGIERIDAERMDARVTNTHTPETTSMTVRKIWQDEDNVDRIRPARLRVTLWGDDKEVDVVTLNAANNWEATVDNLPKYRDGGKEIAYTWAEEATVDYMLRLPVVEGNITTLTNVHTPNVKLTEVSGQKIWDDNHNEHKVRPANITVTLYADGAPVNAAPVWRSREGDTWSYVFSGLPAENAAGATINYTVDETPVEYYTTEISGTTITNRLIPREPQDYKEIKGVKKWEDNENSGATRPDSVTVRLIRDSIEIASVKITEATGWSYSFGRQPVDDGYGHIYNYEVREDGVPGYFCRVEGMNLINRLLYSRPDTPNITTTRRQVGSQYTATGRPPFERYTAEELEDMLYDVPLYGTPLWGGLLGTGDITPLYPFIFGGIGVIAVIVLILIGRKRKKGSK